MSNMYNMFSFVYSEKIKCECQFDLFLLNNDHQNGERVWEIISSFFCPHVSEIEGRERVSERARENDSKEECKLIAHPRR